jgi:hypothetical protein
MELSLHENIPIIESKINGTAIRIRLVFILRMFFNVIQSVFAEMLFLIEQESKRKSNSVEFGISDGFILLTR